MKIAQFKVEGWMNRYESSAKYDLTTTCIKPFALSDLFEKLPDEIFDRNLTYGDITGSHRLKTAIKSLYSSIDLQNITVTHGAIGGNQLVFLSLLEKGDEVVSISSIIQYRNHWEQMLNYII